MENKEHGGMFGMGELNVNFAKYFIGNSYLKPVAKTDNLFIANVTFEPGCRNNWHIHKSTNLIVYISMVNKFFLERD